MLCLTCTTITSVDLAHYGVSRVKDWVSVDCGINRYLHLIYLFVLSILYLCFILVIIWPCLKVFWFSKDNPTGHSERKKKKRQTEEEVGRQYQRVDRNGLCQLN